MKNELTNKQYNLTIGLILLWGFIVNAIMCTFFTGIFENWNATLILIGYFICAIVGICMSKFSDNAIISFIGYNLVVLPVGVVLSLYVKDYYIETIAQTFIITAAITLLMIIVASIKPEIFSSIGCVLFICLCGVIVVEFFICIFVGHFPTWWNLLVALLFCGYIGYDWQQAQKEYKCLDNAVDCAVDLYLNIINLFVRLLGSSGSNKKK